MNQTLARSLPISIPTNQAQHTHNITVLSQTPPESILTGPEIFAFSSESSSRNPLQASPAQSFESAVSNFGSPKLSTLGADLKECLAQFEALKDPVDPINERPVPLSHKDKQRTLSVFSSNRTSTELPKKHSVFGLSEASVQIFVTASSYPKQSVSHPHQQAQPTVASLNSCKTKIQPTSQLRTSAESSSLLTQALTAQKQQSTSTLSRSNSNTFALDL